MVAPPITNFGSGCATHDNCRDLTQTGASDAPQRDSLLPWPGWGRRRVFAPAGAGTFSRDVLTLSHNSLMGNTARAGGGVDNAGGTLTVTGGTIKNNNGGQFGGGGIQNGGPKNVPGTVVVRSSTITGNVTLS